MGRVAKSGKGSSAGAGRDKPAQPAQELQYAQPGVKSPPVFHEMQARELVEWLFPLYVFMMAAGIFLLRLPYAMPGGNALNFDRAVFASVNVSTLTGFRQNIGVIGEMRPLGRAVILLLTFGGSTLTLIIGGLAGARVLRLNYGVGQLVRAVLLLECGAALVGALTLWAGGRSPLGGLSLGLSAFANCGVALAPPFTETDWQTHLIIQPLATLGGIGLPALLAFYEWLRYRRPLSQYTQRVLTVTVLLYVVGFALLVILQLVTLPTFPHVGSTFGEWFAQLRPILVTSSVTSTNARTLGSGSMLASNLSRPVQWAIVLLMIVGHASASTAGGLKTTTLMELTRGTRRLLRGENPGRLMGIAITWTTLYLAIACFGTFIILQTERQLADGDVVFTVISALSNVGLTRDTLSISVPGEFVLCALMLAGRLAPLAFLWWIVDRAADSDALVT